MDTCVQRYYHGNAVFYATLLCVNLPVEVHAEHIMVTLYKTICSKHIPKSPVFIQFHQLTNLVFIL